MLHRSSIQDSALVVVVRFLRGIDLFVQVGEHCCFSKRSLDVLVNLDCKCLSIDSSVS